MELNLCILLYSKYSSNSKKLIDYISNSGVDLPNLLNLQTICVDNEEIRKKIINATHIGIKSVPCLLLTYKDGGLEKYEGLKVFNWFEEVLDKIIKSKKPTSVTNQSQPISQHLNKPIENDIKQEQEEVKQDEEHEHIRLLEENRKKYEDRNNVELKTVDTYKSKKSNKVTKLEELISEDEEIDRYKNRKPKSTIRKNKGNYEEEDFFKGSPDINKNKVIQKKVSDVMNKAKELAKVRETVSMNNR